MAPPIGASFDEQGEKLWCLPLGNLPVSQIEIDDYLAKIQKFDRDIYILEIEDKTLNYRPQGHYTVDQDDATVAMKQFAESVFKK